MKAEFLIDLIQKIIGFSFLYLAGGLVYIQLFLKTTRKIMSMCRNEVEPEEYNAAVEDMIFSDKLLHPIVFTINYTLGYFFRPILYLMDMLNFTCDTGVLEKYYGSLDLEEYIDEETKDDLDGILDEFMSSKDESEELTEEEKKELIDKVINLLGDREEE